MGQMQIKPSNSKKKKKHLSLRIIRFYLPKHYLNIKFQIKVVTISTCVRK